jgi:uncharacterized protein YjiS (DUF1127 family)
MNILRSYQNWRRYRETTRELNHLSDRTLSDMGISRGDIRRVARSAVNK